MLGDTISAISTPLGEGGIGIVRLSGPESMEIVKKIFKPAYNKNWEEEKYKLVYGHIIDPETGQVVDEVLLGVMPGPHSYTREDVVEINCHGGPVPLRKILALTLSAGARLAQPGEFSKRAFLNGRMDLAKAEAVIDIIRAATDDALQAAVNQLTGNLSQEIETIQDELLGVLALVEATIDFPEDEVEEYSPEKITERLGKTGARIEKLIESAKTGRVYREGVRTVIVGKPNVGKSSLLNVLLKEKRAIVTDVPGTTRDIIEEVLNLGGVPVVLIDTAGIRKTSDAVEKIGVERSRESIRNADLVLMVVDAGRGIDEEDREIFGIIKNKTGIAVINKIDIGKSDSHSTIVRKEIESSLKEWPVVEISALRGEGIKQLEETVVDLVKGGKAMVKESVMVTNVRHKNQLCKAKKHINEAINAIKGNITPELVAIDIRAAWEAVGEINGSVVTENIVDKIFSEFCIGK